ncbi:hypothetical protein FE374_05120 [Georgenia yuyongxinii]|uniref:Uncharacterized protein n=1 Tax=Georgenia yuyongxinii TaxID=2589797 RepID=A0A5B8C0K4_9MICO|nr:hypothetical protein [Georgenia yuyongxinii]QDC24093.1 hypothetical protein FE374_05120 [Georgenia yuyongxinii]
MTTSPVDRVAADLGMTEEQRAALYFHTRRHERYVVPRARRGRGRQQHAHAPTRLRRGIPRWSWVYDLTTEERREHVARVCAERILSGEWGTEPPTEDAA